MGNVQFSPFFLPFPGLALKRMCSAALRLPFMELPHHVKPLFFVDFPLIGATLRRQLSAVTLQFHDNVVFEEA